MTSHNSVPNKKRRVTLSQRVVLVVAGITFLFFISIALDQGFSPHEKTIQKKTIDQGNFSFTAALRKNRSGYVYVYLKENRWLRHSWMIKELVLRPEEGGLDANSADIAFNDTTKVITFRIENTTRSYRVTLTGPVSIPEPEERK